MNILNLPEFLLGIPLKKAAGLSVPIFSAEKNRQKVFPLQSLMQIDLLMIIQNQSHFNSHFDGKNEYFAASKTVINK